MSEEVVVMHTQVLSRQSRTFRGRTLSKIRPLVAVAAAIGVLTVVAAAPAAAADARSFTALKACSGLITPTTQTCLVTQSSLKILRGGTIHYTAIVFYADHLTSPVTFTAIDKRESTATGRCTFYFAGPAAGTGHCEYWAGTGRLAGFHAMMAVGTTTSANVYSLKGTYWFDRDDDQG
jgi:hypothetical protein